MECATREKDIRLDILKYIVCWLKTSSLILVFVLLHESKLMQW